MSGIPNPTSLAKDTNPKGDLPKVEYLGSISLETLNRYDCTNQDRRLLSLFGKVYDVTSSLSSYGPDGDYKEFAGHDITLAIGTSKTDDKWLDRFVKMEEKWEESARGWSEFFDGKYPVAGTLDKWDEQTEKWPELGERELADLEKGCVIL